jgi:WD40 repeat protein
MARHSQASEYAAKLQGGECPFFSKSSSIDACTSQLATAYRDGSIEIWNIDSGERVAYFHDGGIAVTDMQFLPDGTGLAVAWWGGSALYDLRKSELRVSLTQVGSPVVSLAVSPDGSRFAGGDNRGGITVWDLTTPKAPEVAYLRSHSSSLIQLAFSKAGDSLVSTSKDDVRIWAAPGMEALARAER